MDHSQPLIVLKKQVTNHVSPANTTALFIRISSPIMVITRQARCQSLYNFINNGVVEKGNFKGTLHWIAVRHKHQFFPEIPSWDHHFSDKKMQCLV